MAMNTFGRIFRISIFGESHGACVGVCIDGCRAGVALGEGDFAADLNRRKSGARGTTPRSEPDLPQILSGTHNGKTTGAPLTIIFANANTHSGDYADLALHPRPSHADFAAIQKWGGHSDPRGGGHFSGRLTLPLTAAGVIAKKMIPNVNIAAHLTEVGGMPYGTHNDALEAAVKAGNSLGGIVECRIDGVPAGWGSPFFNSIESQISHIAFAIPGVRGIEFGTGFAAAKMSGSQHNDPIISENGSTLTNHAGGITGGIANGNQIVFRIALKPTASIAIEQNTYHLALRRPAPLRIRGRHDACFALRVPPIVEAAAAIALADCAMAGG